jgi:hypothetical protein
MINCDHGLTITIWTVIMKKFIIISCIFFFLGAAAAMWTSLLSGSSVFASGVSIPNPGFQIPEPLALLLLGLGIVGLARLGRKKFLKS